MVGNQTNKRCCEKLLSQGWGNHVKSQKKKAWWGSEGIREQVAAESCETSCKTVRVVTQLEKHIRSAGGRSRGTGVSSRPVTHTHSSAESCAGGSGVKARQGLGLDTVLGQQLPLCCATAAPRCCGVQGEACQWCWDAPWCSEGFPAAAGCGVCYSTQQLG